MRQLVYIIFISNDDALFRLRKFDKRQKKVSECYENYFSLIYFTFYLNCQVETVSLLMELRIAIAVSSDFTNLVYCNQNHHCHNYPHDPHHEA